MNIIILINRKIKQDETVNYIYDLEYNSKIK